MGDHTYLVTGENFTGSCRLEVNGELVETTFVSGNSLYAIGVELQDGDEICVAVQSNSSTKKVLSRTEKQTYQSPVIEEPTIEDPTIENPEGTTEDESNVEDSSTEDEVVSDDENENTSTEENSADENQQEE